MTSSIYAQPSFGNTHNLQAAIPVDVEFVSGSVVVSAHQIVLAQRSDVFRLFFASRQKDGLSSAIVRAPMPTDDHEAFLRFVEFCYTGTLACWPATSSRCEEILRLAKLYRVAALCRLCEKYLGTCTYPSILNEDGDEVDQRRRRVRSSPASVCARAAVEEEGEGETIRALPVSFDAPRTVEPSFAPAGAHNPLYKPLPPALAAAMIEAERRSRACSQPQQRSGDRSPSAASSEDEEEQARSSAAKRKRAAVEDEEAQVVLPPIRAPSPAIAAAAAAAAEEEALADDHQRRKLLPLKKRLRPQLASTASNLAFLAAASASKAKRPSSVGPATSPSDSDDEYDACSRGLRSPSAPAGGHNAGFSSSPSASSREASSASEDDDGEEEDDHDEYYLRNGDEEEEEEDGEEEDDADSEYYDEQEELRRRAHRRPHHAKRPRVERRSSSEADMDEEGGRECGAPSASSPSSSASANDVRHPPPDNCHHCKAKKKRWIGCPLVKTHRFCDRCLHRHFGASYRTALDQAEAGLLWRDGCPVCQVTCPCAICKRKKSKIDAGMEVRRGRPRKYPAKGAPVVASSSAAAAAASKKRKSRS